MGIARIGLREKERKEWIGPGTRKANPELQGAARARISGAGGAAGSGAGQAGSSARKVWVEVARAHFGYTINSLALKKFR